jgi:hypothetical protein
VIKHLDAVGNQNHRLATRQLLQAANDIIDCAQGADGEKLFAKLLQIVVRGLHFGRHVRQVFRAQGGKSAGHRSAVRVPFHLIDRCRKLALV